MIPAPKIGGTWLRCPMCAKRWRTRTLRQYLRHIRRRHPAVLTASIYTGPGPIFAAPIGGTGWTQIGVADGFAIGTRGLRPTGLVVDDEPVLKHPPGSITVQMPLHLDQPSGLLLNEWQRRVIEEARNAQRS
jgi:hypothetical protein